MKPASVVPEYLTAVQCAQALNICRRSLGNWTRNRVIPSILVGKVRRYDMVRVREALEKFEQKSVVQ